MTVYSHFQFTVLFRFAGLQTFYVFFCLTNIIGTLVSCVHGQLFMILLTNQCLFIQTS